MLTGQFARLYHLYANELERALSFERPESLEQALDVLRGPAVQVIAGGTDVFPAAAPGKLARAFLDVTQIAGLRGISHYNGVIRIGAATTWSDIVSADLPAAFDALKAAAREVGSVQIQNAGTIAGNLCNASPAADGVPPLLALDAEVELVSAARGTRVLPLSDFLKGVRQTALAADELVSAVLVPEPPAGARSAFEKLGARRYLVISICMTAVVLAMDPEGRISRARVAVGSCSATAQRLPAVEKALIGQCTAAVQIDVADLSPLSPIDDVRGSGGFRFEAALEQIKRALTQAGTA